MRENDPEEPEVFRALTAPAGISPASIAAVADVDEADEERPPDFRRIKAAFVRYKWLVVLVTLLGCAAGFVASRMVTPVYLAQATLWIEVGGADQRGPIQPEELLQRSSWVDLLHSFVVLDEVVRRQRLYLEPRQAADSAVFDSFQLKSKFVPGEYELDVTKDGRLLSLQTGNRMIQRATVGDSIGAGVGFTWLPPARRLSPGREIHFRVRTPRDAALDLAKNLNSILPPMGSFLSLELTGNDPAITAATLNTIADRFVEVAAELKRQKLTELSRILDQQLTSSYADLGRSENELESFRVHTITLPSEASPVTPGLEQTRDPVFNSFFQMRVEREQLDRDRSNILAALAEPDSTLFAMHLEAIPSVRSSSELSAALTQLATKQADARAQRLQFGDAYPPLQRLQAEITDLRTHSIPDLAQRLAADLATRVRDDDSRIGSASHELQAIPQRAIEEARLRRNVTIAENLYTTLQQRYEEARLAEVSSIPDVRVLDRAVPPENPQLNRAIMLLVGGMAGGFGISVALVFLLDKFDRRLRYPEQISLGMGIQVLGVVPHLSRNSASGEPHNQVVEALRAVRLNLEHAYGTGPIVITITSPERGDGKSFLSSNLAVSFAEAGRRVLLIDADIRRGELNKVFEVDRKPGLMDFLTGQTGQEPTVHRTGVKNVDFIPSGSRRSVGPEMLATPIMARMLIKMRATHDVIIIDSPPLGAGVDPLILSTLSGNLLLVVRSGVTDRDYAKAKLEHVTSLPIRVLGAVINDVRADHSYGYYGYYGYLPGYGSVEEPQTPAVEIKRLPSSR